MFICFMVAGESISSETTTIEHISIDLIKESEGDREFKLERILEELSSHKFYEFWAKMGFFRNLILKVGFFQNYYSK